MQLASGTTIRVSIPAPKVTPVYSTRGEKGDAGTPGAPGGSDAALAGWANDPASQFRAALSATYGRRVINSPSPFFPAASEKLHATITFKACGVDDTAGVLYGIDTTNGQLKQSENWGTSWFNNKTVPTDVTATNMQRVVRFGASVYAVAKETTSTLTKVFRATPQAGNTALTWSAALHTMVSGGTALTTSLEASSWGASDYLYLGEYGDPVGGPSIYRSADGATWETVFGPDATLRHVHHVKPDPYHPGHVWATCGDGIAKTIMRSTNYGAAGSWSVVVASSTWQGVQISFTPDYVFIAGDSQRGTVLVIDRDTGTPYMAAGNWHCNIAVPGGAAGDRYCSNAYYGLVDPATGIYYCVANDTSTGVGNTFGMFYLPAVGGQLAILDKGGVANNMNNFMFLGGGFVFTGNWRRPLMAAVVAPR